MNKLTKYHVTAAQEYVRRAVLSRLVELLEEDDEDVIHQIAEVVAEKFDEEVLSVLSGRGEIL